MAGDTDIALAAADRLRWLIDAVASPASLTIADLEPIYDTSGWHAGRWNLDNELRRLTADDWVARPFQIARLAASGAAEATAVLVGADDKRWALTCWVSEDSPHRITGARSIPAPPEGTTVRDATPDDATVLADLERRSPLRLGETRMTFDRGEDYFASARLMDDVTIYVAEVDERLGGVYWGAQQPVLVDGAAKQLFLELHVRIDPETPRGGVFWALCVYGRDTYARTSDSIAFYVSPENEAVRKFVADVPSWSVQPVRVLVPCTAKLDSTPQRATPADAARIVEMLNAAHDGEELFVPYTVESLTARLERDRAQYGFNDLRIGDGAVIGVGGFPIDVVKERGDERHETKRALVLDHGFAPGCEDEYRRMLRATAGELAAEGVTHLAAFTSEPSSTHDVLMALAESTEPFDFWAFDIPEPPSLSARGFYVDPVYF